MPAALNFGALAGSCSHTAMGKKLASAGGPFFHAAYGGLTATSSALSVWDRPHASPRRMARRKGRSRFMAAFLGVIVDEAASFVGSRAGRSWQLRLRGDYDSQTFLVELPRLFQESAHRRFAIIGIRPEPRFVLASGEA